MTTDERLQEYYGRLQSRHLGPLWDSLQSIMTKEPKPRAIPYLWKWRDVHDFVMESGQLVTPERGGERRVVFFRNPGLEALEPWGWGSLTHTLYAGVQLLLPGEKAPSHRHNQNAIRFILEGSGAYTVVEGERVYMEEGDFLITPAGLWHDHVHEGDQPMLWLDCLDIPLVYELGVTFFEAHPEFNQPVTRPDNFSVDRYSVAGLRPLQDRENRYAPQAVFKWSQTKLALDGLSNQDPDPVDGYAVEYVNPATGEAAGHTIGAMMQKLPSNFHGQAHRHVHGAIYHVTRGEGYSVIGGVRFDWQKGDTFVIPNWAWHEHVNTGPSDAYLFSTNDLPVMEALHLERSERYTEGHQAISERFTGVESSVL
ncbi:cupin domain-containing protein [Alicyclobacillus fastidiosus]|uniref:Cupin domain-containing protein n=1 Tax=Alicyclobacillus fastidiosus TaxID=392011 RepID=A0ABY6ZLU6_9BACL|nr:cupin domain-containing protein [Alicyclobacillus fastidiosus]WAH43176.1 cupin domain-containing protein [Alicyclobacillus fastidiosus]GMA65196.1 gentisate 1,2-dioxygenase [Alicyclobacillus fastidiosus]